MRGPAASKQGLQEGARPCTACLLRSLIFGGKDREANSPPSHIPSSHIGVARHRTGVASACSEDCPDSFMALALNSGQPPRELGELEFELVQHGSGRLVLGELAQPGARRHRRAPFASVSMQSGAGTASSSSGAAAAGKHVPAFVLASAVESTAVRLEGVPQWRITAGNLAAGATAGCAVEAGGCCCGCCGAAGAAAQCSRATTAASPGPASPSHASPPMPSLSAARPRPVLTPTPPPRPPPPPSPLPHRHHQDAAAGDALRRRHPSAAAGGRRPRPVRRRVGQPGGGGPLLSHLHGRVRAGEAGGARRAAAGGVVCGGDLGGQGATGQRWWGDWVCVQGSGQRWQGVEFPGSRLASPAGRRGAEAMRGLACRLRPPTCRLPPPGCRP